MHFQALARLGAETMAIDAAGLNISVAKTHAALDPSFGIPAPTASTPLEPISSLMAQHSLEYRHCAAEDLVKEGKQFDVVCAMEVIEHVDDPRGFLDCLSDLTKVCPRFIASPPTVISDLPCRSHGSQRSKCEYATKC